MLNVGIVGTGAIGSKRAKVVSEHAESKLSIVCDLDENRAETVANLYNCEWTKDWQNVVKNASIDVVIIAVITKALLPICVSALNSKKHVLAEKPLGRNPYEAISMVEAAYTNNVLLKVGFNHRYHPAYRKLVELYKDGQIGEIFYVRSCYGHGGRPGYEKEWRGDKESAGGGELLDQGVHIVDLARNLIDDFVEVFGYAQRYFWEIEPLEDNGFALLRNAKGQLLSLHASWTQWKNLFRFEVFGSKGYLIINGLGGSYGAETLILGKRRPESGPPDETVYAFAGSDESWSIEWQDFANAIVTGAQYQATGMDGYQAVKTINAIYESSKTGSKVML